MSYARWSKTCPWYIYWLARDIQPAIEEEVLVIQDVDFYTYRELRRLLAENRLSDIPGCTTQWQPFLTGIINEFIRDVQQRHGQPLE